MNAIKKPSFRAVVRAFLADLGNGYFDRGDELSAHGWTAFQPMLAYMATYAEKEAWVEFKQVFVEERKQRLTLGGYTSELVKEHEAKAAQAFLESACEADKQFPRLRQLMAKDAYEHPKAVRTNEDRLIAAMFDCQRQEANQHCHHYKEFESYNFDDRLKLFKRVLEQETSSLGFSLDKKLSTRKWPAYTKPLFEGWRIGIDFGRDFVDKVYREPFMSEDYRRAMIAGTFPLQGSPLYPKIVILHESKRQLWFDEDQLDQNIIAIDFNLFFPLVVYQSFIQLSPNPYCEFLTHDQFERLLLVHIFMYRRIQEDLELRIIEGLKRAKKEGVGPYGL